MESSEGRLTCRLLLAVLSVSFGTWFGYGYAFGQINSSQTVIVQWIRSIKCNRQGGQVSNNTDDLWCKSTPPFAENPELNVIWGIMGSSVLIGGFFSTWTTNIFVAKLGIKNSILWTNVFAVMGTILTGICTYVNSHEVLIIGRFLLGFHGGLSITIVPMYVTEISPCHLRGALGTLPGFSWTIGVLAGVVFGIPQLLGTVDLWPYIFWIRIIPVLLLFLTMPFCPESPCYLVLIRKRKDLARAALTWLRGTQNVQEELKAIQCQDGNEETLSLIGLLRQPFLRKLAFIVLVIFIAQQFSGFNGISIYSTAVFEEVGIGKEVALFGSIGLMATQSLSVLVTVFLSDRLGRRPLLLVANFSNIMCLVALVIFMTLTKNGLCDSCRYGSLVAIFGYMLVYNLGTGFAPWVISSEMFGQTSRGAAMMIASGACHGFGIVISFLFPVITAYLNQWTFAVLASVEFVATCFLFFRVIETKGKDISTIQAELHRKLK